MVLPGPAPEAIPELVIELVHGAALSAARGVAPEPVHALSVDLAPLPVHSSGRGVVREVELHGPRPATGRSPSIMGPTSSF